MTYFTKLFYRNTFLQLHNFYRYSSSKTGKGKWADMQNAKEWDFFTKKDQEYLYYIKSQLKKGKNIKKIMEEYKKKFMDKVDAERKRTESYISDKRKETENYVLTKNKQFMEYIKTEIHKGRKMDDIITEIKRKIEDNKSKSRNNE